MEICRCITQKVKNNVTIFKQEIVVLSIDILYVHLQISPTYSLRLVRFSVKLVEFQIFFVKKLKSIFVTFETRNFSTQYVALR